MRRRLAILVLVAGLLVWAWLGSDVDRPRWWKGNTHTHTLWSDGNGAPELVTDWYIAHGYDFLVYTDHNVLLQGETWYPVTEDGALRPEHVVELGMRYGKDWVVERTTDDGQREMLLKTFDELRARFEEPGSFLMLAGEEISDGFEGLPVHVNGINLAEPVPPQGGSSILETIQKNIDAVIEQGRRLERPVLAHLNHPNFSWAVTAEELARMRGESFFEVYNGHPAVHSSGDAEHPGTERAWDVALTLRLTELDLGLLYGVATDDGHDYQNHGLGKSNPGRGWIVARAGGLDARSLVGALNRGDFYASTGVVLEDVVAATDGLSISIATEPGLTYTTDFIGTRWRGDAVGEVGEVLLSTGENPAVYTPLGDELYVRARVTSSRPHRNPAEEGEMERAWIQPVVVMEL